MKSRFHKQTVPLPVNLVSLDSLKDHSNYHALTGSSRALMIVKEIERGLSLSTWTKNFNVDFLWQREEYPGGYRKESPGQGGQRMSTLTFFDTLSEITSVCNVLLVANEGQR